MLSRPENIPKVLAWEDSSDTSEDRKHKQKWQAVLEIKIQLKAYHRRRRNNRIYKENKRKILKSVARGVLSYTEVDSELKLLW